MIIFGTRFGRVTVQDRDSLRSSPGRTYYTVLCDCGKSKPVRDDTLKSGAVVSCGCKKKEHNYRHGHRRIGEMDPTYTTWDSMVQRCTNPNSPGYKHYGERGIGLTPEWLDFKNFLSDMGERPSKGLSLDRIDNDKGYYKENCRWATQAQQMSNTRVTGKYQWEGRDWTLTELSETYRIHRGTLRSRLKYLKWDLARALGQS